MRQSQIFPTYMKLRLKIRALDQGQYKHWEQSRRSVNWEKYLCILVYNFVYVLKCDFGWVNGFKRPTLPPSLFVLEYLISFTHRRHLTTGLKGVLSIVKVYLRDIHSLSWHVNITPFIRSESNIGKDFRDDNYCHVQKKLISWMVLFVLEYG